MPQMMPINWMFFFLFFLIIFILFNIMNFYIHYNYNFKSKISNNMKKNFLNWKW